MVLSQFEIAGLQAKRNKFIASNVSCLSHVIDSEGLHPIANNVMALEGAPEPEVIT